MSADGTWKLCMQTPIGERKSTLALTSAGGALTGKLTGEEGNATDIYEGKAGRRQRAFEGRYQEPHAADAGTSPPKWTATRFQAPSAPAASAAGRSAGTDRRRVLSGWAATARNCLITSADDIRASMPPGRLADPATNLASALGRAPRAAQTCAHIHDVCARIEPPAPMTLLTVRHATTYRYKKPVCVRRASHDVPAARQLRPEAARGRAHDLARARELRWVHDVFGNCVTIADFRGPARRAALREQHLAGSRAVQRPRLPDRGLRAEISVHLRARRDAGPAAGHRARNILTRDQAIDTLGAAVPAQWRPDRYRHAADDADLRLQGELHLRAPHGAGHARPGAYAAAQARQLPRPGPAHDRGAALARLRGALRVGLSVRARAAIGGRAMSAAARRTRGARSTCRAQAGWSSIPPTPSSAIAISSASPWRATRARPSLCRAPSSATPATSSA